MFSYRNRRGKKNYVEYMEERVNTNAWTKYNHDTYDVKLPLWVLVLQVEFFHRMLTYCAQQLSVYDCRMHDPLVHSHSAKTICSSPLG